MRRLLAMLVTATLLVVSGCGSKSYEARLTKTLEDMKYLDRLNRNLAAAPTKPKFEELSIFVRPPLKLQETKAFMLGAPEPGLFDLEASFDEPPRQSLHILARVKVDKTATKTKKAVEPPQNRGEFGRDVLAILNSAYTPPPELTLDKFKEEKHRTNTFKKHVFQGNNKNVQVYLYTPKGDRYEVAFVFEFPSTEQAALITKITLCLESFATGPKAKRAFAGTSAEEEGPEVGSGGGVAF
jgi:hypothetical protein